jgi:heme-degrading monooxygenase HmoA
LNTATGPHSTLRKRRGAARAADDDTSIRRTALAVDPSIEETASVSVVKINAISVPAGAGPELEARFAGRARAVEQMPGFEDFQLLRPVEGEDRYFVYTRWDREESFQAWMSSQAFGQGHGQAQAGHGPPVSSGATLLSFEVVQHVLANPAPLEDESLDADGG